MNKVTYNTTLSLLGIVFISSLLLTSTHVFSDTEVIDQVRLTVPIACTMSGTGTTHTATLSPGTYSGASGNEYENGIGKTTLTAICNDDNGFSIYAIGYTGNSYDSENHTKLVGTNTGGVIATKAYASGDTTSSWSMKLTKITDSAESYNPQNLTIQSDTEGTFSNWHSIPSAYTKVAEYHANTGSSTTDTTLGVKLETTYAAYISSSQPADTYIGQVKYTMVHPYTEAPLQPQTATSGCINYFPNGSNVDGTMGCQSISKSAKSATLLASNFSRTGYGFAGWSNKFDYATNPNQEGIKFYGPQEDITFTAGEYTGSNNGLALYAVWVKSEGSIQDTTKVSEVCNRLTTAPTDGTANLSSVSAFTDSRDNNTYAVAKLADGNCWMIENLRLDNTASLTLANTNNPLNDGTNVTLKHSYSDTDTHNTLSTSQDPTTTAWCTTDAASCDDQSMLFTGNTTNRASYETGATMTGYASIYSYGNYYNWYSATAGNGTYSTGRDVVANGDLCPTGWHLPYGDSGTGTKGGNTIGGFYYLNYKLNNDTNVTASNIIREFPVNFLHSGYVYGESLNNRGSIGYFWSSTANSTDYASYLYLYSYYVHPGTIGSGKHSGMTVRCVASF